MTDNRGMIDHLLWLDIIMQKVYVDNNDKQLQFLSWNRWICCVVRMHQLIDRKLQNTVKDHSNLHQNVFINTPYENYKNEFPFHFKLVFKGLTKCLNTV